MFICCTLTIISVEYKCQFVKVSITAKLRPQSLGRLQKIDNTQCQQDLINIFRWQTESGLDWSSVFRSWGAMMETTARRSLLAPDGSSPWQHFSINTDIVTILGDISQPGITFRNILQMMSARTALEITLLSVRAHNWIIMSSFQMPAWFSLRRPHTHFPFYYVVSVHKSQQPKLGNKCVYVSWSRNKQER